MEYVKYILQGRKIFILIILSILMNSSFSYLAFKFPYAFKLSNKNIFVIHQLGVSICNQHFTESISRVVTFSETEKITTDKALSKVTSVIADNYIICLINDMIYIFDEEGYLLKKSNDKITNLDVEYYTLVYVGKDSSNNLYFVVGFINNREVYLYSYIYQPAENSIQTQTQLEGANHYSSDYIIYNGLSCNLMHYYTSDSNYQKVITCLYYLNENGIAINYYEITTSTLQRATILNPTYFNSNNNAKYIKSTTLPDKKRLLIGWLNSNGVPNYGIYDINSNTNSYLRHYFMDSY